MKKIFMIPLFAVFAIGAVIAGVYVVNNFVVQSDVYESFDVSYAVLGDAGNYETGACSDEGVTWIKSSEVESPFDMDGLYVGESRKFCVRIDNAGEGEVPYVIQSSVIAGNSNLVECQAAFPEVTETGLADGSISTYHGVTFTIPADATPTNDCQIDISVARGTLE